MIDSYMFVTGGRPAIRQRNTIAGAVKGQGDERDYDAKIAQSAPALPQMRNQQGKERDSVKPNGAVKAFEMVIEIFQPQFRFGGINRWR